MIKKIAIFYMCVITLGLMACSTHNTAAETYSPKKNNTVAAGALGDASVGAIIGSQEQQEEYNRLAQEGVRVIRLGDIVEITIPSDKLFYPNEANLTYNALPILSDTLAFINSYGAVKINVSAHGDTTGTLIHGLELTRLQAQAVMTYFWAHGKPLDQMEFYGMNHQEPVADQDTETGEYFNRRIEIMFWKNQAGK
ncbi:MAG: putative lipoprotein YiaD [Gammaproteobacteria bacterium]|nr:putative lipoprotein YiaD [Gammaproteobacteria bacterium]